MSSIPRSCRSAWRDSRGIRDWFRAHPTTVPAYARFKTLLAAALDDIDTYSDIKDPVVDLVIAVADDWAAETGWTP